MVISIVTKVSDKSLTFHKWKGVKGVIPVFSCLQSQSMYSWIQFVSATQCSPGLPDTCPAPSASPCLPTVAGNSITIIEGTKYQFCIFHSIYLIITISKAFFNFQAISPSCFSPQGGQWGLMESICFLLITSPALNGNINKLELHWKLYTQRNWNENYMHKFADYHLNPWNDGL